MTNLQEEHAALQETFAALKSHNTELLRRVAELEQQVASQQQRLSKVFELEKDIEAQRHAIAHYELQERCREADQDKQRQAMRGFDSGG